jgi:hypothetical protein
MRVSRFGDAVVAASMLELQHHNTVRVCKQAPRTAATSDAVGLDAAAAASAAAACVTHVAVAFQA